MKKKSLSAKKTTHNNLLKYLDNQRINKTYKIFNNNLKKLSHTKRIAIAISGGPDSLALSYLSKCFSLKNNIKVLYYNVDHRLRKNSSTESKFLQKKLKNFDINSKILKWNGKKPNSNIQSQARKKRYSLIFQQCLKNKVKTILTAHHIDDLYENFFIRILRGSGLEGFVSFNSIQNNSNQGFTIARPLININKNELIYISNKVFKFYLKDPSNKKDIFMRVRLRKLIKHLKNEGLDFEKLKLTINNLSDSNRTINYFVSKNIENNTKFLKNKSAYILNNKFFNNPNEIVLRSFSKILLKVGKKDYPARGKSILKLMKLFEGQNFNKMTLSGCIIEKLNNSVIIYREFRKIT